MERAVELAALNGAKTREIDTIGDRAVAAGYPALWWRNGDVLGQVYAGEPLARLVKSAQRVDALLD